MPSSVTHSYFASDIYNKFKNKRKYIKLSGYAWEDKRVGGKDNKAGNEKCDVEENTESN